MLFPEVIMQDVVGALETYAGAWRILSRDELVYSKWTGYVRGRFSRTGDVRALQFIYPWQKLYPNLNRGQRSVQSRVLDEVALAFELQWT